MSSAFNNAYSNTFDSIQQEIAAKRLKQSQDLQFMQQTGYDPAELMKARQQMQQPGFQMPEQQQQQFPQQMPPPQQGYPQQQQGGFPQQFPQQQMQPQGMPSQGMPQQQPMMGQQPQMPPQMGFPQQGGMPQQQMQQQPQGQQPPMGGGMQGGDMFANFQNFMQQGKRKSEAGTRDVEAQARERGAQADLAEARAKNLESHSMPGQSGFSTFTDQNTGRQFYKVTDATGKTTYHQISGDQPTALAAGQVSVYRDAHKAADDLRMRLKSAGGMTAFRKAAGSYNKLLSIDDPDAQKIAADIQRIAMGRVKASGRFNFEEYQAVAQTNFNRLQDENAIDYNLDSDKAFFDDIIKTTSTGRPGLQEGNAPKPKGGGSGGQRTVTLHGPDGKPRDAIYNGKKFVRWSDGGK